MDDENGKFTKFIVKDFQCDLYAMVDWILANYCRTCFFSIAVRLSMKRKSDSSKKDKRRKWLLRWSGLEWHKTVIQRWGNRFEKRGVLLMWLYMPVAELLLFFTNICGILWPEIGQSSGENLIFMCMDLWELCAGYLVDVKRIYCSVSERVNKYQWVSLLLWSLVVETYGK